ncbi:hypothetical protein HMPREF3200_00156 [Anaerococcus tetradius]|uniref:Uncharacterized protein n=1 Tax=Anaerococcus tetradius TaxID=33036 RepID=A0A133KIK5_9FIRM|nr:hypothetical protein HMPREF3200_00156 [Anaerococcus tetradius]
MANSLFIIIGKSLIIIISPSHGRRDYELAHAFDLTIFVFNRNLAS